jgi:hypothetical protein
MSTRAISRSGEFARNGQGFPYATYAILRIAKKGECASVATSCFPADGKINSSNGGIQK